MYNVQIHSKNLTMYVPLNKHDPLYEAHDKRSGTSIRI